MSSVAAVGPTRANVCGSVVTYSPDAGLGSLLGIDEGAAEVAYRRQSFVGGRPPTAADARIWFGHARREQRELGCGHGAEPGRAPRNAIVIAKEYGRREREWVGISIKSIVVGFLGAVPFEINKISKAGATLLRVLDVLHGRMGRAEWAWLKS